MALNRRFLPQNQIAVDVDGTILLSSGPNQVLIEFLKLRKAEGFGLMLWSAQGEAHAREVAERFDIVDLFDVIVSKPGYIVDDKGWQWARFTKIIRDLSLWAQK